jgi:hypothetical protein
VKLLERWKGAFYSGLLLVIVGLSVPVVGLIFFFIEPSNQDTMFFDYLSRYLIGGLPLLIWGIVQMYTSYKHREDITYFAHGVLFIDTKSLKGLLNDGIIEGKGTYMEPYYIVKREYNIGLIRIRDIEDFLLIEGWNIPVLIIFKCENIIIDYNIFKKVKIRESHNLTLKNNTIEFLHLINAYFDLRENNDIKKLREVFP